MKAGRWAMTVVGPVISKDAMALCVRYPNTHIQSVLQGKGSEYYSIVLIVKVCNILIDCSHIAVCFFASITANDSNNEQG